MVWLVITILLGVAFWIGVALFAFGSPGSTDRYGDETLGTKPVGLLVAGATFVGFLILTFATSIHTLGTGQTALVYDFSGRLSDSIQDPGIVWTAPWQHVKKENVFLQQEVLALNAENSAVSRDQQSIFAEIALNFEVDPKTVEDLYRNVGPGWREKLIEARVLQDFKEVTSTFSAQEITTKREQLRRQTRDRLKIEFEPYSIRVVDFFVKNLSYSAEYEQSINAKNVQVQKSLEARAAVDQAKAEANQVAARASGEARAIRLRGAALRANPEVLRLNAIEKLNPNAVVVYCSHGDCPTLLDTSAVPAAATGRP